MDRAYYSLVTSLPELRLDDYKEPYRVHDFIDDLREHLLPRHLGYVRELLGIHDALQLVDVLLGQEQPWHARPTYYTFAQLRQALNDGGEELPDFLAETAEHVREYISRFPAADRRALEGLVLEDIYARLLRHENRFISAYARFDYALRSALARAQALPGVTPDSVEAAVEIPPLKRGVRTPWEWGRDEDDSLISSTIPELVSRKDLVQTEKTGDTLRWQKIDELTRYSYFDIDMLLGYLLKLTLVERWIRLETNRGREVFSRRTRIDAGEGMA